MTKRISALPKRNRKDVVGEGTGMIAIKATELEYIENRTYKGKGKGWSLDWLWGGGILILFLVFRPWEGGPLLYLFLGVSAVLIFGFIYHYIAPKRYFIANRQTGMLKLPTSEKKEAIWVAFDDGFGFEKTVYASSFYTTLYFITKPEIKPSLSFSLALFETEDYWNFIVWYMDKNRPLPPGKAFDPYREQDFERRKAAGFPKPLYPSSIPTPEFTEAQQKERKRIGGW
ncbi:hypothetical protein [Fulvivirga sediminis]|uniref:Uncharacterized protein n=1 Tax=Fulvivirga sediminis TaxID=2803949 RepID=A0A937FD09_9BACT|nr:hypothetical protein [Fulvivirga sediminis]MBL3658288.1 hypothetical protein [Fulvivirga sediminis]